MARFAPSPERAATGRDVPQRVGDGAGRLVGGRRRKFFQNVAKIVLAIVLRARLPLHPAGSPCPGQGVGAARLRARDFARGLRAWAGFLALASRVGREASTVGASASVPHAVRVEPTASRAMRRVGRRRPRASGGVHGPRCPCAVRSGAGRARGGAAAAARDRRRRGAGSVGPVACSGRSSGRGATAGGCVRIPCRHLPSRLRRRLARASPPPALVRARCRCWRRAYGARGRVRGAWLGGHRAPRRAGGATRIRRSAGGGRRSLDHRHDRGPRLARGWNGSRDGPGVDPPIAAENSEILEYWRRAQTTKGAAGRCSVMGTESFR